MITDKNLNVATLLVPSYIRDTELALTTLHSVLNTITPDAAFEYEFIKVGNSARQQSHSLTATISYSFDVNIKKWYTFDIVFDKYGTNEQQDNTLVQATINETKFNTLCTTGPQLISLAQYIHKTFVRPLNTYDQSISINDLSLFQKSVIMKFATNIKLQQSNV